MNPNFDPGIGQMLKLRFKWMISGLIWFCIKMGVLFLVGMLIMFLWFGLPAIIKSYQEPTKSKPPAVKQHKPAQGGLSKPRPHLPA